MTYSEMRQFLREANQEKLSPVEKDVFLFYDSRIRDQKFWNCPDTDVAEEIGRSRNSICEGRNGLKKRGWISEKLPFRIEILKRFPVGNATDIEDSQSETRLESPELSRECDSPVENATEPVGNATAYKDKGIKKVNIEVNEEIQTVSDADLIFNFWQVTLKKPRAKFTKARRDKVRDRIKEGYTVDDLKTAILGCSVSPHNQGQNDRGEIYDDLELICRTGEKVERFVGIFERHTEGKLHGTHKLSEREKSAERNIQQRQLAEEIRAGKHSGAVGRLLGRNGDDHSGERILRQLPSAD